MTRLPTPTLLARSVFCKCVSFDSHAFELYQQRANPTQEVEPLEPKETQASAQPDREQPGREEARTGAVKEGKRGRVGTS